MSLSQQPPGYIFDEAILDTCTTVIVRSGAAELIDSYYEDHRGTGGRSSIGPRVTILAVLVVGLAIFRIGGTASIAEICRMLNSLTRRQRVRLGMEKNREIIHYKSFHAWLTRRLHPLDTGFDLPARRVKNREHRAQVAARTEGMLQAVLLAERRRDVVMNALVAGSIDEKTPKGAAGDVVADETIVDVAGPSAGMGNHDDKRRSAVYLASYYVRDGRYGTVNADNPAGNGDARRGFGIGITALSRVGHGDDLQAIAPVITAVAAHQPTSGYLAGLEKTLLYHRENGFDQRKTTHGNCRQPNLTVDMGYNTKIGFSTLALEQDYAPVARYPKNRTTVLPSESPEHLVNGVPAGPIQISGAFYCPAARKIIGERKLIWRVADLGEGAETLESQDRVLQRLFPLMMGTNTRPKLIRETAGRPRATGDRVKEQVKIKLVCPAVQGRVRCPLKPESLRVAAGKPLVKPDWSADQYRCCSNSLMTMTYSERQWKLAQWGLVPGSWEHALYFEAARAATERQFSRLKSPHESGIQDLKWSPRREPMICVLIGLWVAATNLAIQDSFYSREKKEPSIRTRMRSLERDLGRPPMRTPPRT